MEMINKQVFLESRTCLTKGWYLRSSGIQYQLTQADLFRINEGVEIGKMARSLYPQGILVNEGSNNNNYEKTKQLINDDDVQIIFEATFIYKNIIAKADILERIDGEWHLIEVKSSAASDDIKDELINDLTYTSFIVGLCGIELKKMSLFLVSKNYRIGMDNRDFFVEVNCTEEVNNRKSDFINRIDDISNITGLPDRPEPKLIYQCKNCDFYKNDCLGKGVDDSVFDLPYLSENKFNDYIENDITQISQIPAKNNLSSSQKTVWTAVNNKKPFINKEKLSESLSKIIFPAYYLDFESVRTAIPLYPYIGPYEELVTQYSIHKISSINSNEEHFEFLADYTKDDRKTLAEKLITDIGKTGSVIVYHADAEKRFIKNLATAAPNLADELINIIDRIVDLKVVIKESYYYPSFHGSYSIKVVLPVLVPDMSYKNLVIGDGQSACVVFAELARDKYSSKEAAGLCQELLRYCKQDTLAMVEIHKQLYTLCN